MEVNPCRTEEAAFRLEAGILQKEVTAFYREGDIFIPEDRKKQQKGAAKRPVIFINHS